MRQCSDEQQEKSPFPRTQGTGGTSGDGASGRVWLAVGGGSIAAKLGCGVEALRRRVHQAERNQGRLTTIKREHNQCSRTREP